MSSTARWTTGFYLLASLTSSTPAYGQVTTDQVSNIQSQFDALSLSSAYPDGFGIPLKAQGALSVVYPSGEVQLGKGYSAAEVATLPTISVSPTSSGGDFFKGPFTLMLADANVLGHPDPKGNYRHFLENGATFGDPASNGTMSLNAGSGTVVTAYAGPGPALNEGPHRYAWMLFVQPSSFLPPSNLSSAGVGPGHWYVDNYVSSTGLGDLIAASFFTVENGHANFTPKATLPTNTTKSNTTNKAGSSVNTTSPASTGAQKSAALNSVQLSALIKSFAMGVAICGMMSI